MRIYKSALTFRHFTALNKFKHGFFRISATCFDFQPCLKLCVQVLPRLNLHPSTGIEEAEADLSREQYERLWQQGVLGRVPVVGRVVQWWAPPAPARGRRLQLASGRLQPTDDVYK